MNNTLLPVSIAPLQPQDQAQWRALWHAYQVFYQVELGETVNEQTWQRFFIEQEPLFAAVAKQGETLLGFVHFVYHRSTWAIENYCYLEDLYVVPNARGQQIGKQLIEYVQCQARQQSCARLYWHTQEKNKTAQKLYDWLAEKPGVIEYRMKL